MSVRIRRPLASIIVAVCVVLLLGLHSASVDTRAAIADLSGVQLAPGQQAVIGAEVDASKRSARGARSLLLLAVLVVASAFVASRISRLPAFSLIAPRRHASGAASSRGPPA